MQLLELPPTQADFSVKALQRSKSPGPLVSLTTCMTNIITLLFLISFWAGLGPVGLLPVYWSAAISETKEGLRLLPKLVNSGLF